MPQRQSILTDLRSDDVDAVREAAFSAGEQRCVEAVPLLVEHLKSRNLGIQEAADARAQADQGAAHGADSGPSSSIRGSSGPQSVHGHPAGRRR